MKKTPKHTKLEERTEEIRADSGTFGLNLKYYKCEDKSSDWFDKKCEMEDVGKIMQSFHNLEFLYVPSINTYVAKKTIEGTYWIHTHEALQANGLYMPTLNDYVEFLKYLKFDKKQSKLEESRQILKEIFNPAKSDAPPCGWSKEWIDARFVRTDKRLFVCSNHKIKGNYLNPNAVDLLSPETREWFREGWVYSTYCEGASYKTNKKIVSVLMIG